MVKERIDTAGKIDNNPDIKAERELKIGEIRKEIERLKKMLETVDKVEASRNGKDDFFKYSAENINEMRRIVSELERMLFELI